MLAGRPARSGSASALIVAALSAVWLSLLPFAIGGCASGAGLGLHKARTEIPGRFDAETMAAAAEEALVSRGYAIVARSKTETLSQVVGEQPGHPARGLLERSLAKRATIIAPPGEWGTRVEVRIDPVGDELESASILESTLSVVGLTLAQR